MLNMNEYNKVIDKIVEKYIENKYTYREAEEKTLIARDELKAWFEAYGSKKEKLKGLK